MLGATYGTSAITRHITIMGQFRLRKKYRPKQAAAKSEEAEVPDSDEAPPAFRPKPLAAVDRNQIRKDFDPSKIKNYNPFSSDTIIAQWHGTPELPKEGAILGKCKLLERIGKGSSCIVFKALHRTLEVNVAVKIFLPDKRHNIAKFRQQFRSEAQLLAKLSNPYIVRVLDFENRGLPYIIMEYVDGISMIDLINNSGAIEPIEACRIIACVADGLETAHRHKIIHRDIKPENILIGKDKQVKLADLGIAALKSGFQEESTKGKRNVLCGTPAYVAPEQALEPESASFASDVYSLGATFYHTLVGQYPFEANTVEEMIYKHISEPLVPPCKIRKEIPKSISNIVEIMMDKDPQKRFDIRKVKRVLRSMVPSDTIKQSVEDIINEHQDMGPDSRGTITRTITRIFMNK